jgi:hypothetical protein
MTEKEKAEQEIKKQEVSLEELRTKLVELTAEFRKNQDELSRQIYNQNKDEFADIDLVKLITVGVAYHKHQIGPVSFVLKTLTKEDSLAIDKMAKAYINETREFYLNSVQTDTLAYVLVEYNEHKSPMVTPTEDAFKIAKHDVGQLASEIIDKVWSVYNRMTRYIRAALETNLKN